MTQELEQLAAARSRRHTAQQTALQAADTRQAALEARTARIASLYLDGVMTWDEAKRRILADVNDFMAQFLADLTG